MGSISSIVGLYLIFNPLNKQDEIDPSTKNLSTHTPFQSEFIQANKSITDTSTFEQEQSEFVKNKETTVNSDTNPDVPKTEVATKIENQITDDSTLSEAPVFKKEYLIEAKGVQALANSIIHDKDKAVGSLKALIKRYNAFAIKAKLDPIEKYDSKTDKDDYFGRISSDGIAKLEEIKFIINISIKFTNRYSSKKTVNRNVFHDSSTANALCLLVANSLQQFATEIKPENDKSVGYLKALINRYNVFAIEAKQDSIEKYNPSTDKDGYFGKISPEGIAKLVEIISILETYINTSPKNTIP